MRGTSFPVLNVSKFIAYFLRLVFEGLTSVRDETKEQLAHGLVNQRDVELESAETERKEPFPAESENVFRQIAEAIPAVFWVFSVDMGQVVYVNPAYEEVYGRSCETLYKQPGAWVNYVYPEDRQRVVASALEHYAEEHEMEYRIVLPDGSIRWVHDRASVIKKQSGEAQLIVRFVEDITERKRVEESLRDLFQTSADIVQAIPSGLLIYRRESDGRLILQDGNPAAERLIGIRLEEWRYSEFDRLWPRAHEIGLTEKCFKVIETGEAFEMDDFYYKDKRFEGVLRMRIFRMTGDQLGIAFENITERKRVEEMLKKSREREVQAYALGRLEVLDTSIHNIGNAINSVTTGIGTILENLRNNKLIQYLASLANAVKCHQSNFADYVENDPQGQKVAQFIIALSEDFTRQNEELVKIVSRVREKAQYVADIIRTEKKFGKKGVYRKEINLKKSIEDAISFLQDSIKKRNIEVSIDCDDAPAEINVHESQFHQMLVNLIKNSIEAIDELESFKGLNGSQAPLKSEEPPFIKIRSYVESDCLILEVIDNGIGIEKDKIKSIFEFGYTTKGSGSGLGLYSVANFVNSCDGQVLAKSDGIGKGTTMQVSFRLSSVVR